MEISSLKGKTVLVKFSYTDSREPVPLTLLGEDERGIWFQNNSIAQELIGEKRNMPPMLNGKPTLFVPLSRIEWLMVPGTDGH